MFLFKYKKNRQLFITFLVGLLVSSISLARESIELISKIDTQAPIIEHDIETDIYTNSKDQIGIQASVKDDSDITSVVIYYRGNDDEVYKKQDLRSDPSLGTDTYASDIPLSEINSKQIEYYIEASDTSGNKRLVGMSFSPIKRNLIALKKKSELDRVSTRKDKMKEVPASSLNYAIDWIPGF